MASAESTRSWSFVEARSELRVEWAEAAEGRRRREGRARVDVVYDIPWMSVSVVYARSKGKCVY